MTGRSDLPGDWHLIEVDGEEFEWWVFEGVVSETRGLSSRHRRESHRAKQLILYLRRPGDPEHSLATFHDPSEPPTADDVVDTIRRWRDTTALSKEWRRPEDAHARALARYWGRLSLATQRDLAQAWLERCERRYGTRPAIDDADDLHEISAKVLGAARAIGLPDGDDEAAAQEREVRAAFDREVK